MTTGTDALLTWFRRPLLKNLLKINVMTNGPNTTKTTNASRRQYRIHIQRTCYRCQQEGHYARDCPCATTPKPAETRMEKMQSLLRLMTPNERAQFKREVSPQMMTMQAHLRTMTMSECMEFKRQITTDSTQMLIAALRNAKMTANPLSRETSPHTDKTFTGPPPSRETGPHPSKSRKKLAQALKKRANHEAEQRTKTPHPNYSRKVLAEALKCAAKTPQPNVSTRTLANALTRYTKRKSEQLTRTYAERIRKLIGPPEQCEECGGEHPTQFCMKHFKKLRKPETTPIPVTDDGSTNSDMLCDSEESEDDETEPIANLTKGMQKLSLVPAKSVTFDLREDDPDALSHNADDSMSDQNDGTEEPTFQNEEVDARLAHAAWLRKTSENVYISN